MDDSSNRKIQWYELSKSSLQYFCRMNDQQRFRSLLEPILVPRVVGSPSHRAVSSHLARILSASGFTIQWDEFTESTPHGKKPFKTLIATHDPNVDRRLVLACHYDSKILKGEVFIGATDSAVPCAMLLEIASTLGLLFLQDVTLQLIFFDGEEAFEDWSNTDSIYGARHLASMWKTTYITTTQLSSFKISTEIDRIDLLILLDLLGAPNPHLYDFSGYSSSNAFFKIASIESLRKAGCLHRLPRIFQPQTIFRQVEDDHLPFLQFGVPVMHLIPIPFPAVWHTAFDNADILSYETIDNLNSILRVFIANYFGLVP
ncbi:unnamed protein product [Thelazia callipaeda]|uniref:Glutaminyl-peptide cyclotransferase n=1 Tax=Thelazia callipaeda TaxID=103827 RepID=A0A0N5D257_THECL|nr:unnamed protein product [Thelazia callipaeda]